MTASAAPQDDLAVIESQFHALIRRVVASMGGFVLPAGLPRVEAGLGRHGPMWLPVPGMYGGFSWTMHQEEGDGTVLVVESWSRVVGGSGQRHRITRDGCVLESEGFV